MADAFGGVPSVLVGRAVLTSVDGCDSSVVVDIVLAIVASSSGGTVLMGVTSGGCSVVEDVSVVLMTSGGIKLPLEQPG